MGNVAKWAMRFGYASEILDIAVTGHVQAAPGHDYIYEPAREQIALAVRAWWDTDGLYGAGKSVYPSEVELLDVTVTTVEPDLSDPFVLGVEISGSEGGAVAMLPPQCAWGVSLRTTSETRNTRGRVYLPALDEGIFGETSLGKVSAERQEALAQTVASLAQQFRDIGGVDSAEYVLCVYSRLLGSSLAVTHFDVPDRIRTQRRRAFHPAVFSHYGLDGVSA